MNLRQKWFFNKNKRKLEVILFFVKQEQETKKNTFHRYYITNTNGRYRYHS